MRFSRILPLVIGVLSLLWTVAEHIDDIDEGTNDNLELDNDMNDNNVSSTFLDRNFTQKTNEDQRYWYSDDADRKSKADILSRLFKIHIDRLRNKTDQVDLIGQI